MKHIVHIIPSLGFGGAERFIIDLVRHSASQKIRYSVVTLWDTSPLKTELPSGVAYYSLRFDTLGRWQRTSRLAEFLREKKADIVHTHLFSADLWGRLAARRAGLPVITTEHNVNADEPFFWTWTKRLMRHFSDIYTAPSQAVVDFMQKKYHISPKRVHIIRYGIELKRFIHIPKAEWKEPYRFLCLGRLVPQKGHTIAIEALAMVKNHTWTLDIVGEGTLQKKLKALVRKKNLQHRVRFIPPTIDVGPVLKNCDALLMPSLWEGLGIVVMEAMAAGRLVIASHTGGMRELIRHEDTGLFVTPGEKKAWSRAIRWCFDHPREAGSIARQAQTYAEENFGLEEMVEHYQEVYERLGTGSTKL